MQVFCWWKAALFFVSIWNLPSKYYQCALFKGFILPWSGSCFFFFTNLPMGCHLWVHVIPLKDAMQFKAVWSVSPRTCGHVQLNADSRGESWKLELVSTVSTQHRHSVASNIPAGNSSHTPSVWSVLGANPVVFKYTDGHSEKKNNRVVDWYLGCGAADRWILIFLTREQTCMMALQFNGYLKTLSWNLKSCLKTMIPTPPPPIHATIKMRRFSECITAKLPRRPPSTVASS